jgi:MinD-like ATPase involved in chromosome partitioning or flagellar assembly
MIHKSRLNTPYIIRISSHKGGVGKSIISINLAVALKKLGYDVLVIDADLVTPSIALYLGVGEVEEGFNSFITNHTKLKDLIIPVNSAGIKILPGIIRRKPFIPKRIDVDNVFKQIDECKYDFVIVDTNPGIEFPETLTHYNVALIVTNLDIASISSAAKLKSIYTKNKLKNFIVVNKFKNRFYEISLRELKELDIEPISVIPEDDIVNVSIAEHVPAYNIDKKGKFQASIDKLAKYIVDMSKIKAKNNEINNKITKENNFFEKLRIILFGK